MSFENKTKTEIRKWYEMKIIDVGLPQALEFYLSQKKKKKKKLKARITSVHCAYKP